MEIEEVIYRLKTMGDIRNAENKANRFGITATNALGVNQKELKQLSREIGTNNALAIALFETGIYEARLLCSKVFDPDELTAELMDYWADAFDTWEMCDSSCMGFFVLGAHAKDKILEWSQRPELFVKRAAFAMVAAYGFAHKDAPNEVFEEFLTLVLGGSTDERHYVKKAVNWALRNIGKRNPDLHSSAQDLARQLESATGRAPKWIGAHARRELSSPKLRLLNYPRSLYGARP